MKKKDFLKGLRPKSYKELVEVKVSLLKELFSIRMQMGTKQLSKNHIIGEIRRNIARVSTLLSENQVVSKDG